MDGLGDDGKSKITAIVQDGDQRVYSYNEELTLTIKNGGGVFVDNLATTITLNFVDGIASTYLQSDYSSGATITAYSYDSENSQDLIENEPLTVGFYSSASKIILSANPGAIPVGGLPRTSTLTAMITDDDDTLVNTYEGNIQFSFTEGFGSTAKFAWVNNQNFVVPVFNGKAIIDITSLNNSGDAILRADVDDGSLIFDYTTVYIQKTLKKTEPAVVDYSANGREVTFDIELLGGDMEIVEMMVSWYPDDSASLQSISLNNGDVVTGDIPSDEMTNGNILDITDTLIAEGVSSVKLSYGQDITDKDITIIFYPVNSNYNQNEYTINL